MIELYLTKPEQTVIYAFLVGLKNESLLVKFKQINEGVFTMTLKEFNLLYEAYMKIGVNSYIKNKLTTLKINSKSLEK